MRALFRFPVLLLALAAVACQTANYNGPGNIGKLPAGTVTGNHRLREDVPSNPPRTVTCDTARYQTVTMNQLNVDCDPFNYKPLFDKAVEQVKGLAAATECPVGCTPAHSWIESMQSVCQGTTAAVILEAGLICPRPATTRPVGVTATAGELIGAPRQIPSPLPAPRPSVGAMRGEIAGGFVSCNPVETVMYDYREAVTDCSATSYDFQAHVEYAQRRAPSVCGPAVCAAGCKDIPTPALIKTAWRCRGTREVVVEIDVQCCIPTP